MFVIPLKTNRKKNQQEYGGMHGVLLMLSYYSKAKL